MLPTFYLCVLAQAAAISVLSIFLVVESIEQMLAELCTPEVTVKVLGNALIDVNSRIVGYSEVMAKAH